MTVQIPTWTVLLELWCLVSRGAVYNHQPHTSLGPIIGGLNVQSQPLIGQKCLIVVNWPIE
jgi:hypothetical protein